MAKQKGAFYWGFYVRGLGLRKVELLPYHAMGEQKHEAIGMIAQRFSVPTAEDMMNLNVLFADGKTG